jgi:hypothetical protein
MKQRPIVVGNGMAGVRSAPATGTAGRRPGCRPADRRRAGSDGRRGSSVLRLRFVVYV